MTARQLGPTITVGIERRTQQGLVVCLLALLVAACGGTSPKTAPSVGPPTTSGPQPAPLAHASPGRCPPGTACFTPVPAGSLGPSAAVTGSIPLPTVAPAVPPITFPSGTGETLPSGTFALAAGKAYTLTEPAEQYPPVTLAEVSLASGARRTLATRPAGHVLSSLVLDGDHLLWVESWYAHPQPAQGETGGNPNAGQPLLWQIVSYSLSTETLSVRAGGQTSNLPLIGEGASPQPPVLAADGDRVVFAEDAGANGVAASAIFVRSLSTNGALRVIKADGYVTQVGLAGQALFYRQTTDGFAFDSALMLARADAEQPIQIDAKVSDAAMEGEWLVWSRSDATDASIWTASLALGMPGLLVPVRVPGPSLPIDRPGQTASVAVGDGVVAWIVWYTGADNAADSDLVVLRPGEIAGRVVAGQRQPDWVSVQGRMLLWHESLPLPGQPDTHAVSLSAIPAMP